MGAVGNDSGANNGGRVYVYSGKTGALLFDLTGQRNGENLGHSVAGAGDGFGFDVNGLGDVDGDGSPDFALTATGHDAAGNNAGMQGLYALYQAVDLSNCEVSNLVRHRFR